MIFCISYSLVDRFSLNTNQIDMLQPKSQRTSQSDSYSDSYKILQLYVMNLLWRGRVLLLSFMIEYETKIKFNITILNHY